MRLTQQFSILIFFFLLGSLFNPVNAQLKFNSPKIDPLTLHHPDLKVYTRTYGAIVGLQRGKYTFVEFGVEKHWTKLKLVKQRTFSLGANMEYNFKYNVLGYKISAWTKVGRINLTYGLNLCYLTDFNGSRYGVGPAIGFRLLGFHFINGYNFTVGDEMPHFNTLYVTLRYYFPLEKKIRFKKKK
jgi:hypothetical protein